MPERDERPDGGEAMNRSVAAGRDDGPLPSTTPNRSAKAMGLRTALGWTVATHVCRYLGLLVLVPFYGRVLGPDGYGQLVTAISVQMVVWIIANWGFSAAGTRIVASSRDRRAHVAEFGRQVHGRMLTGSIALIIGAGLTVAVPILRAEPALGILATLNGIVSACNFGWFFQGRGRYREMAAIEVCNLMLGCALVVILVSGPADAVWALTGLLVANIVALAVASVAVLRDLGWNVGRPGQGLALMSESAALFGAGGIAMIAAHASGLVVGLYASPSEVAYYGAAERIFSLVIAMTQPFDQVMLPAIAGRLGSNDRSGALRLMRRSIAALAALGACAALVASTAGDLVMPIVFGAAFGPSAVILAAFAPAFLLMLLAHALNVYVLIALHRDRIVAMGLIIGTVAGLTALLLLVPAFGGVGAAIARSIAFAITIAIVAGHLVRSGLFAELRRP
ncbi:MAG: oligosaccharide flippase family protein [Burkholderiales bacterium]|jgi:PST family polysaccharide transporter